MTSTDVNISAAFRIMLNNFRSILLFMSLGSSRRDPWPGAVTLLVSLLSFASISNTQSCTTYRIATVTSRTAGRPYLEGYNISYALHSCYRYYLAIWKSYENTRSFSLQAGAHGVAISKEEGLEKKAFFNNHITIKYFPEIMQTDQSKYVRVFTKAVFT